MTNPDLFGPKTTRSPALPRHEPPAVCRYGSAPALMPLRPRDSAPFDFRRRTCCRFPGPKTEGSEVVFLCHKNPASGFWLPLRTTSPCGAAPPGLLPRVADRTIRRSPGSPRIRGTERRFRSTTHAARNSSRLFVSPSMPPRHGGNETQGRPPAEERGDLALMHGTFPRERGGVPPGTT